MVTITENSTIEELEVILKKYHKNKLIRDKALRQLDKIKLTLQKEFKAEDERLAQVQEEKKQVISAIIFNMISSPYGIIITLTLFIVLFRFLLIQS